MTKSSAPRAPRARFLAVAALFGAIASLPVATTTSAPASAASTVTRYHFVSAPGDFVGAGATMTYTPPTATIGGGGTFGYVGVGVMQGTESWNLTFAPPVGKQLVPGVYMGAQRTVARAAGHPGIDVSGDGRGCNNDFGSFTVNTIQFDQTGHLAEFDASFVQHCESPTAPALTGRVQFKAPPLAAVVADVTTPTTVQGEDAVLAARVTLAAPTPTGSVTFFDGAQSLGTVSLTSPGIAVLRTVALPVGVHSITAKYSGDASHAPATSSAVTQTVLGHTMSYWFVSTAGDYIGGGAQASYTPATASFVLHTLSTGAQLTVTTPSESWTATIGPPTGQQLAAGTYSNALRFADATHPGVDVGGDGRGCNQAYGSFVVSTIATDASGNVTKLAATFQQHCESPGAPLLRGVIHYNA